MNGAVEVANKNINKIIKKMVLTYKDWPKMLPFSLYDYRTSARTSTGETTFSLVYGMEVVLPVEVQIPSLRIMEDEDLDEGTLLYPKIFPPIFHSGYYPRVSRIPNLAQKLIRQILFLSSKSAIRVLHFSKKIESSRFQMVFIGLHVSSRFV